MGQTQEVSTLATNKLIRNTYMLLSMTLLFSAFTAGLAMKFNLPHPGFIITLVGFFGLFFLTSKLRNSVWGLASVFALTGFMGMTLGPMLNMYINTFSNGHELIIMAFGTTAVVFLGLSGYAMTTKKDFSYLSSFLFVGLLVMLAGMVAAWLFNIPGLQLAVSGGVVLLMAGFMLYDTSNIVNGHETNYIMATVALYVDIFNMFVHLLAIFGLWGED
ncbi:Bax inhibitor-1/YccA family protein [Candidatus Venteria ishoeyi]|nr:Bax inhibitor-1/YccA family protein [Candidatus Venteria ishoeyi]MDM8547859.1 Bax inhibitor-1/YccA family protein [Candidatus Venteria ishoeyi]